MPSGRRISHWWPSPLILCLFLFGYAAPVLGQDCSKLNPCATGCCSKSGWCGTTDEHCGAGNCVDTCDYQPSGCNADKPCKIGCCSKSGYCGLGPDYCSKHVCVASCDAKAECDPGFGAEWAESEKCPLNVCCSEYGFCGTTEQFCGDKKVKHRKCSLEDTSLDRVVGYYESWASRRPCNAFWPEQIPLGVYTHLNFAFAAIDPDTFEIRPSDSRDIDLLLRLTNRKRLDPGLKVMVALGGWAFNNVGPTRTTFSDIARSKENQTKFLRSLVSFLATHNLDGVDLDWEYPVADDRGGREEDFKNFPTFLARLKNTLESTGGRSELSITLPASYWYLQNFDIVKLQRHVDFFNIMSYDLHGTWDLGNKWTGNFLDAHTNLTEIDKAMDLLWRNDIDSSKVVLGLAFYARTFTVEDPSCVTPGCRFSSGGEKGDCSRAVGVLLNNEIDEIVAERILSPTLYKDAAVQVVNWDDQWLSFDNKETLQLKSNYARKSCLGGVMVWAVSHDTPDGKYSHALSDVIGDKNWLYPGMFRKFTGTDDNDAYITKEDKHLQCKWSNCGELCPTGWVATVRDDKWKHNDGEIMLSGDGCARPHGRRFCCPPDEKTPACGWYSFKGGKCDSGCPAGYREVGSIRTGCRSGYQAACCKISEGDSDLKAMKLYETCDWAEAPDCRAGKCTFAGSSWPSELVASSLGSGASICYIQTYNPHAPGPDYLPSKRKYCCDRSNKNSSWGKCEWRKDVESIGTKGKKCKSGCASNQVKVALEAYIDCLDDGAKAYCCQGTYRTQYDVLVPELKQYEYAMAAWMESPVCAERHMLDPRKQSSEVVKRKGPDPMIVPIHEVGDLLSDLIIGYESGNTGNYFNAEAEIFNNHIKEQWPNLQTGVMLPYTTSDDTYPNGILYSPQEQARHILCHADLFNDMISDSPTLDCGDYPLEPSDYEPADGSDDGPIIIERSLVKRGEKRTIRFPCRSKKGNHRNLKITLPSFPSSGEWNGNAEQVRNAYDLSDSDHCHTPAVQTHDLQGQTSAAYATEHLIELQSLNLFLKFAIDNNEQCKEIDCDFILDFLGKPVLGDNVPNLNGVAEAEQQIPIQRIAEMLGSRHHRENFVLLRQTINLNKAQLWSYGKPRKATRWTTIKEGGKKGSKKDPTQALELIRDTIAVFNYLRKSEVWDKFKAINQDIRTEIRRAQDASGKENLLDCWDGFMEHILDRLVNEGKAWISKAIKEMSDYWLRKNFPNNADLAAVCAAVQDELMMLEDKAISAVHRSHFNLNG